MFGKSLFSWAERPLDAGRRFFSFVLLAGMVFSVMAIQPASPVAAAGEEGSLLSEELSAAGISAGEWDAIQAEMDLASYQFVWREEQGAWAPNGRQGFDLYLGTDTLRFEADSQDFSLGLQGWGDDLLAEGAWQTNLGEASRRLDSVTETVENAPEGLVYQIWIEQAPQSGETVLAYSIEGGLTPALVGQTLALQNPAGQTVLQLDGLEVVDGQGQVVPASFSLAAGTLFVQIEAAQDDPYPLTVTMRAHSQTTKITASDAQADDYFGARVAIDGDVLVVGAPGEDTAHTDVGAVYVFHRMEGGSDAWGQVRKIVPPNPDATGYSISVDVSGDVIVVGAHKQWHYNPTTPSITDGGAVFVYQRMQGGIDNWGLVKQLISSDIEDYDFFGKSVSVSGDVIVAGAPGEDTAYTDAGAVYVFHRNHGGDDNWGQVQKLLSPSPAVNDYFGTAVAVDGDTFVVGTPGYGSNSPGTIYIFQRTSGTSWTLLLRRSASSPQNYDRFGSSVDIDGDVIVVGVNRNTSSGGTRVGRAYVFHRMEGGDNNWGQVKLLTASDSANSDWFGYTVSVSGNVIVIGAFSNDSAAADAGAAYIFARTKGGSDNWGQVDQLIASDISAGDQFGISVAVSGDVIVAGANHNDTEGNNAGAAYVFQDNGAIWREFNINTASDAASNDNYGQSVAVSGDVIAIGAPNAGTGGAVYVIHRMEGGDDRWGEVIILTGSDTASGDNFGESVALCGDVLVVGARGEDDGGSDAGAAYVFYRNEGGTDNWGQKTKLTASNASESDYFGTSVGISGDVIVVGARNADGGGAAYIYQRNEGGNDTWGESKILVSSDLQAGDNFGVAVGISGDVIVVGADLEDTAATDAGAAYIFQRMKGGSDNWGQVKKLRSYGSGHANDRFGCSVAVDGDVVVIGAWGNDDWGPDTGLAYIYHRMEDGDDSWGSLSVLRPQTSPHDSRFGHSVAIYGDTVAVGGYRHYVSAPENGVVAVYQRSKNGSDVYGRIALLSASDHQSNDYFGWSVAVWGDMIVVGAPDAEVLSNTDAGKAYIFQPVLTEADLSISKSASPDPVRPGQSLTYTLSVENQGPDIVGDITMTDTLPAGVTFQSASGTGWTCNESSGTVTCNRTAMSVGAVSNITITVLAPSTTGVINNTASVSSFSSIDPDTSNNSASIQTTVNPEADLSISKSGSPNTVSPGQALTYTVSVNNAGPDGAENITMTDVLPAGVTYQSASGTGWSCSQSGGTVTCTRASLAVGAAQNITINVLAPGSEGSITNTASVTSDSIDTNPSNNNASAQTTVTIQADLSLSKTASPSSLYPDEPITYTLSVNNAGPDAASGITVTDTLPAGVTYQSASGNGWTCSESSGTVTCTRASLAVGTASNITITVLAPSIGGNITNTAAVTATTTDPNTGNNSDSVTVVVHRVADLRIRKTASPDTVIPRKTLTYTLSVRNSGPNTAYEVTVVDTLPASVTFQSASGTGWSCSESGGTVTCTMGSLAVGWASDIIITVEAPTETGEITNTASVLSPSVEDLDLSNNSDSIQTMVNFEADLGISKSSSPNPVVIGQTLTYTLSVNNAGPSAAENITVTDMLPTGVTYQIANGNGWTCSESGGTVTCTRASLAVGTAPDITITVLAPSSEGTITNTASVTSDSTDTNSSNNTASEQTTVAIQADLSLGKTASPSSLYPGETITYTLSVNNTGPGTASGVTVTDTLPAGVTYQSASGDGWTCSESGGTVTCTRASLAVGAAPDIIITVLAPSIGGNITNTAAVTTTTVDPNTGNDSDTAEVTVEPAADLSLSKTASSNAVPTEGVLTYTVSVENLGGDPAENVVVTDTLPAGVTYQNADGTGWSCSESGGTVTCTRASLAVGAASDITITVLAPSTDGNITNTASVTSATFDPNTGNNSDTAEVTVEPVSDLSLSKTASPSSLYPGETITYILSVNNVGPDAASDITVTDTLPAGVTYQSASGDGWTCGESGGTVTCTRATLTVGTAPDITIVVLAPSIGGNITNTAAVTAETADPHLGNNSDTAGVMVEASADLSLTKTASPDPVMVDGTLTYTLTVTNLGGDPAQNVVVTDVLPAGVTFQSASGTGWSCSESGGTVTCTLATLAVGAAPDIMIVVTTPSMEGDLTNTASVSTSTYDPVAGNNSDSVTVSVSDMLYFFIPLIIR